MRLSVRQLKKIIREAVLAEQDDQLQLVTCEILKTAPLIAYAVADDQELVEVVHKLNTADEKKRLYYWQVKIGGKALSKPIALLESGMRCSISENVVMRPFDVPNNPSLVYVEIDAGPDTGGFTLERKHVRMHEAAGVLH
jgi:hypothetical protein